MRVPIKDDELDEVDIETFTASLVRVTDNRLVSINPGLAEVRIEDTDGKTDTLMIYLI